MYKQMLLLIALCYAALSPAVHALANGDEPVTCVVGSNGSDLCLQLDPDEPSACEQALNEVWNAAEANAEAVMAQPFCEQYRNAIDSVSDSPVNELAFSSSNKKLVLIKRRTLRNLKRKARANRCL